MELTRRTALKTGAGALIVATTAGYATAQTDEGEATLELLAEENVDHQHACLHGDFDERTPLEAGELDEGSPTVDDTHVIWEVAYEGDQRYVVFDADAHFADGPFVFYTADGSVTAIEGTELERGPVDDEEHCDSLEEYVEIEPEDGRIALELVADLSEEDEPEDEDEADDEDEPEDEDEADDEDEPEDEDEADDEDEPEDEDEADDEDEPDDEGEEDDEDGDDEEDDEDGDDADDEEGDEDGDETDDEEDAEDGVDDDEDGDDEAEDEPEDEDESEDEDEALELSVSGPNEISIGESAQFHATVRNRGGASAEPTVTLEVGSATASTTVDLDAGGCRAAWLCVDGADLPAGTHDWSVTSGSEVTTGMLTVTESSE